MTAAEEIKSIRAALGLTQTEFGAKLGVTWRAVARWEAGDRTPSPAVLMLARKFRKSKRGNKPPDNVIP